ncbi:MAG TPA: hypothetical protein VJO16_18545 [Candidatus Acidoferrum sp.]|nr:hypothetical protein [Candidatus Acidoferrum sp.]
MRILLDNCTPRGVIPALQGHEVKECRSQGWDRLRNGDLLRAAEAAGFDVFITTYQSLPQQQNLRSRGIAVVILESNRWRIIRQDLPRILTAVERAQPGKLIQVTFGDKE